MTTGAPPPDVIKAASRLGAIAELEAIVLRKLHWTTADVPVNSVDDIEIHPTFNVAHGRVGSALRYQVNSTVTGRCGQHEVFRMEATHEAFFSLPEGEGVTEEDISSFGVISAFFMVYPYIREALHGLSGNAGLPAVLLRPYRIPASS